ncbi:uncharacterized protein LOC101861218 [Aplysia californica]|uniref:Uncharacterized protein LOC101861218 n=1 Tax=Aplysia californica TaxID=6500 RepID=A0ABM1A4Q7_APLCA|nr:uncharacterized protein LOC101861218 [Aplysia californica]
MPLHLASAVPCHVIFFLAFLAELSHQQGCGNHVVCTGQRPKLSSGCCPVQAGQPCRPADGGDCDSDLGFHCGLEGGARIANGSGICQGQYDLRATSNGQREVELAWSPFAPPDYLFEYVLFMREGTFNYDINNWNQIECGDQPHYTARRLKPATAYYFQVAIWEDARNMILGTTTETLLTETRPVEFCEHKGLQYQVNQTFVHDCEDNCTCLANGQFECFPLCPEQGIPELEEGCHLTQGNHCCEVRVSCSVGGEVCDVEGVKYSHGDEFESGCKQCVCMHGELECQYPPSCQVLQPSESCPNPEPVDVEGACCPDWSCGETCVYENATHAVQEYFTSTQCGLCRCQASGVVHCAPDCPPVVMVLPDAACPDPHVRQDGCCDTLHCYDPSLDVDELIRRMFALSYSPVTLTLSFEVDAVAEQNGVAVYPEYEVMYTNTTDLTHNWRRRVVRPVDVRLHQDQSQEEQPDQALTTERAIVVDNRAYVTIAGMYPNTTYYVKIRRLADDATDQGDLTSANSTHHQTSAMVVIKTMPLKSVTSCFHAGQEVPHEEQIPSHCSQVCTCRFGQIVCESACPSEHGLIAVSPSCPRPRLEKTGGECCPTWKCYPSDSGCHYDDLILAAGQSVTSDCRVCTCYNGTMHCQSACPPVSDAPRAGCELSNVTGLCCPQWSCPREIASPLGVESSILLRFRGSCTQPVSKLEEELGQQVFLKVAAHIQSVLGQGSLSGQLRDGLRVELKCDVMPEQTSEERRKRSPDEGATEEGFINVVVILHSNWSSSASDFPSTGEEMYNASLRLTSVLNNSRDVFEAGGTALTTQSAQLQAFHFLCDTGFSYQKGSCVLSEIETAPSFFPGSSLSVAQVSSNSVTLQWSPATVKEKKHILGFMIEYRRANDLSWLATGRILPTVTSQTLNQLSPNQEYVVRLLALTFWPGKSKWPMATAQFTTDPYDASASTGWTISLGDVTIAESYAILSWDPLPDTVRERVSGISVAYRVWPTKHFTHKLNVPDIGQTHVKMTELQPSMAYVAELALLMTSGAVLHSQPIHFETKAKAHTAEELKIVSIIAGGITLVSLLSTLITCLLWRRDKAKYSGTAFENKGYGKQVTNNNYTETEPAANPASV